MSVADVRIGVDARLREIRLYYELLRDLSPSRPGPPRVGVVAGKGLLFVQLYGALEYCVVALVQDTLRAVNARSPRFIDVKPAFLSVALHDQCLSLANVGPQKVWPRRRELFARAYAMDPVAINDTVFPADSANLRYEQLQSVWDSLCVPDPVLPRVELRGRINEVTENRNAIAHGRETPATVGSRYTIGEMEKRVADIRELCEYYLQVFDHYIRSAAFLA